MSKIQILPEHLIGQIKAGEVVERPAALIKEIIENALDANADQLELHIEGQGLELISLFDNGQGMTKEDLPLAFCRHATSKIEKFDDLYNLHTFGFRGEALASIASISRVTCTSAPENLKGGKIVIDAGLEVSLTDYHSHKRGTSLWIRDLFYNTPARLKFIRQKSSEKMAIKKVIEATLLAHPDLTLSIQWDGKDNEHYPKVSQQKERFKQLIKNGELIEFSLEYEETKVEGYLSLNGLKPQAKKIQALLCNHRWFEEKTFHKAIARAMSGFWSHGETGHYLINLSTPPDQVDVNVHPQKTHLKFEKSGLIFGLLSQGIKGALQKVKDKQTKEQIQKNENDYQGLKEGPNVNANKEKAEIIANKETGPTLLTPLNDRYFLITPNKDRDGLLIDSHRLLGNLWRNSLDDSFPLTESETTPLLISKPFKSDALALNTIEKQHVLLKNIGLEVDRISPTALAIRSIPSFLGPWPFENVLSQFLEHISKWKKETSLHWKDPYLYEWFESPIPLNINECKEEDLIKTAYLLLNNKTFSVIKINNKHFNSLFDKFFEELKDDQSSVY